MREGKFSAREKKTHKMTRDGLVEKSALSKEERRISSRTADFSLDKKKPHPKTQESKGKSPNGKKQKQRDFSGNLREETISPYEALEQEVAADAEEEAAQEEEILPQKEKTFEQSNQKDKAARKGTSFREEKQSSDRTKEKESSGTTEHRSSNAGKEKQQKTHRTFQFDRGEQTKEERTASHSESTADSRQKQKVCKAEEKAEKAAQKLDDAKENLPKRTRLTFEREFDAEHGKAKRRLSLKTEEKPEAQTSLKKVWSQQPCFLYLFHRYGRRVIRKSIRWKRKMWVWNRRTGWRNVQSSWGHLAITTINIKKSISHIGW